MIQIDSIELHCCWCSLWHCLIGQECRNDDQNVGWVKMLKVPVEIRTGHDGRVALGCCRENAVRIKVVFVIVRSGTRVSSIGSAASCTQGKTANRRQIGRVGQHICIQKFLFNSIQVYLILSSSSLARTPTQPAIQLHYRSSIDVQYRIRCARAFTDLRTQGGIMASGKKMADYCPKVG